MQRIQTASIVAATFIASTAGAQTCDLFEGRVFPAGQGPIAIAIGDWNGDGKPDLAVANQDSEDASILLGDGAGRFAPPVTFPAGSRPSAMTAGDLNGDGELDLAIADLNLDGRADIAFANYHHAGVSILLNQCPVACGSSAKVTSYGTGKAGALGVPQLQSDSPVIGQTALLQLLHAAPGPAFLLLGTQSLSTPFDRGTLLVDPLAVFAITVPPSGVPAFAVPIPAKPLLCGASLYFQALVIDAAADGPYHTAQSAGLHWTIGS